MKNVLIVTGLSLFLLTACGEESSQSQQAPSSQQGSTQEQPPKNVGVLTIVPQQVSVTSELPGRVRSYMTAEIRPQVSGIIQERLFKEGSFVEKGQQLYQIDPARYQADLQRAKASLQNAQAERDNARVLEGRYQRLIDANAVSQQEYDNAAASVKQAQAAVSLAQAEVKTAEINLEYTKVYAPISGYIGPSAVTEGALVTAQQEMALATVRQLDPVYVDLSQSASEARLIQERLMASRLTPDAKNIYEVTILLGNEGETYPQKGSLDATDLAVDENTGTIQLRSVFENPEGLLLPGMFVRATIEEADAEESIIVPQKAVQIQAGGVKNVWIVAEDNTAARREVTTGSSYENNWIITQGLEAGDKVIVEGAMMLQEGAKLAPQEIAEETQQTNQTVSEGNLQQPPQSEADTQTLESEKESQAE